MNDAAAAPPVPDFLVTARLVLRRPVAADAAVIFRDYAQDPLVARFMIWAPHRQVAETEVFVATCQRWWNERVRFPYIIARQHSPDVPIGMIELRLDEYRADFGYVLGRSHWGLGYTSEALRVLVDWSLAQPSIYRAQAYCDIENPASARVMEKAGLQFEGIVRRWSVHPNISPEPRDCRLYAQVRG